MLRRPRQINAGPRGRGLRSLAAALGNLAGLLEEHVVWRLGDFLRSVAEIARWPLERIAWTVERRLVWPLQDRAPALGGSPGAAGAGALAVAAFGAAAIAAVLIGGGGGEQRLTTAERVVAVAPTPVEEEPGGPVLEGVPPKFDVAGGVGVASGPGDLTTASTAEGTSEPAAATSGGDEAGATTSQAVPAGPVAMKVARRFSEAFVFYEIGERPAQALSVFEETASPELATALAERPPRQPQAAGVPKARILNLVPGPRRGAVYTVSASLLRVGTVSELRLKLAKQAGAWLVTDVRG